MKKMLMAALLCFALIGVAMPGLAYAQSDQELTEEQRIKEMRINIEKLECEAGMNDTLKTDASILATGITMGTDKTIYGATNGAIYKSHSDDRTIGSWGNDNNGWVDCRSEFQFPGGEGEGYCWGWIGKYITVSDSGSQNCNVIFTGRYEGILNGLCKVVSPDVGVSIYAQVYDVTDGGFIKIAEKKIVERKGVLTSIPNNIEDDINHTVSCELKGGHNYLVRLRLYTEAEAGVSPLSNEQMQEINTESETDGILEWSLSDFHNDGAGGQGVDYTKVKFDW